MRFFLLVFGFIMHHLSRMLMCDVAYLMMVRDMLWMWICQTVAIFFVIIRIFCAIL